MMIDAFLRGFMQKMAADEPEWAQSFQRRAGKSLESVAKGGGTGSSVAKATLAHDPGLLKKITSGKVGSGTFGRRAQGVARLASTVGSALPILR